MSTGRKSRPSKAVPFLRLRLTTCETGRIVPRTTSPTRHMTLAQLEAILAERLGTRTEEATRMLRGALSLVAERLEAGESVKLAGFGTFEVRERPPRRRKDPRDGRDIEVPARRGVVFRPSRRVVASVNRSAD